jgi:hypothetical protein
VPEAEVRCGHARSASANNGQGVSFAGRQGVRMMQEILASPLRKWPVTTYSICTAHCDVTHQDAHVVLAPEMQPRAKPTDYDGKDERRSRLRELPGSATMAPTFPTLPLDWLLSI